MKIVERPGFPRAPKATCPQGLSRTKRTLVAMVISALAAVAPASPLSVDAISPRRLLEVADFGPPVVSPDGGHVAFRIERAAVERDTYDTLWYVQRLDGRAPPRRVADGGLPLRDPAGVSRPAMAVWSPDGRWIYYRAQLGGRIEVWRAAADGSGAESVTRDPADVRDFSLNADGETLLYSVGATRQAILDAEEAEYRRGIRIDETVPIGQGLFRSGSVQGRLATQRFGRQWFEPTSLLADVPERWKALDLVTRETRVLESGVPHPDEETDTAGEMAGLGQVVAEPGGARRALLARPRGSVGVQAGHDVEISVLSGSSSRRPIVCEDDLCRRSAITGIQWRPASDEVLFTVTDPQAGWTQSIYRWHVSSGSVRPVVRTAGLVNGGRDPSSACGVSKAALACVTAEADRPPRLERIDLETGQRQVLYAPNAALALDIASAVPARPLRWADAHGQVFTGQLFRAPASGTVPPPLLVTYYSCPGFLRGGVGDEWPLASLAAHGISALCIDRVRHGPTDRVAMYDQALSGIESAISLLASEGAIDPGRVGLGGLSFGSGVALWVAAESELLKAVSASSPVVTPNYYRFNSLRGDAFLTNLRNFWQLGAPDETPERWHRLSPAFNLEKFQAPILFQMPEQEYLYALEYAIPLMRAHRADLYVFPNAPHQKFLPSHKLATYERNFDWFRFWLQDHEDEHPDKADQYAHWRRMKAALPSAGADSEDR